MALKHGNKNYYQVLIDPHRSKLIEKAAEKNGIKGTAWVREAKDELLWRESVQRRIDGRKANSKS